MGRKNRKPTTVPTAAPAAEQPAIHHIGGLHAAETGRFWMRQLAQVDRESVLSLSAPEIITEISLNGLEFVSSSGFDPDLISRIANVFVHALEEKRGEIEIAPTEAMFEGTELALFWIIFGLLERRLEEKKHVRAIWTQIFWVLGFIAVGRFGWWIGIVVMLGMTILCFASQVNSLRDILYTKFVVFYNPQILSPGFAPLLLLGPVVGGGWVGWLGWVAAAVAAATVWVSQSKSIRYANRLAVIVAIVFNISLVLSGFWNGGLLNGLVVFALFNWDLMVGLVGLVLMLSVVAGAFLKDFILSVSAWRKSVSGTAIVAASYLTFAPYGWIMGALVWTVLLITLSALAVASFKNQLIKLIVVTLALLNYLVVFFQTGVASFIILCSSPGLWIEWIRFLVRIR
jgi:hypothetical protein